MSFANVGVIGAGSWGTALALLLHGNGVPVTMWGHDAEHVREIAVRRENRICLPGVALPEALRLTAELRDLRGCDLLLLVTPSKAVREVAARLSASGVRESAVLLSCTKGVERGSGLRMSEVIAEHFPNHPLAALSGPSHAEEVARKMPTCVVLGCADSGIAVKLQRAFTAPFFRAYTS
ncbi:MAG: 2-dehydropantoate 2-reductase N-terminal domain-containing protein, partial [Chthoniobacteraceae bacterium]